MGFISIIGTAISSDYDRRSLQLQVFLEPPLAMPRATTDRFSRAHQPSAKQATTKNSEESNAVRNPIFNTERFGQHILKNPLVAQG